MIAYLAHYVTVGSREFIYNAYNSRFSVFSEDVTRGNIYTADGKVIAQTSKDSEGKEVRLYPEDRLFAHVTGYSNHGLTGLEANYSFDLLKSHIDMDKKIGNTITGIKSPGDDLYTTLDYDTQKAAYEGMGDYDGAVIAMDPSTGKILAMVSKPDYNPNTIAEDWEEITDSTKGSSVLLNRATNGAYPPGSTFKIITTLAYLRGGNNPEDFSYKCNGKFQVGDYTIHCSGHKAHGNEDLLKAFSNSCNSAYASMGLELDRKEFIKVSEDLLFNKELPTQLSSTKKSKIAVEEDTKDSIVAQTAIGQGKTTVTPLHMCMIASAIANDGELMEPYMTGRIVNADGELVSHTEKVSYGKLLSLEEVNTLRGYMASVVEEGTAKKVKFGDLDVYGKSGTAEFTEDKKITHSWFVGYAQDENGKKIAVAVILEGAGSGSKFAAPLAAKVFNAYLEK